MNILVAFKVCPDYDKLRAEDICLRQNLQLETYFLPNMLNCYDESALELVLRIRDKCSNLSAEIELSAISAGGGCVDQYLQTLQAVGYAHTVRICADDNDTVFCPERVADVISEYAINTKQDIVVVGRETPSGNHGVIPSLISFRTGFPIVTSVCDITDVNKKTVTVLCEYDGTTIKQTINLPCILSVGNAVISKMRIPTLRERLAVKDKQSARLSLPEAKEAITVRPTAALIVQRDRGAYVSPKKGTEAVKDVLKQSLKSEMERV